MGSVVTETVALIRARGLERQVLAALGITPPSRGHIRCPTLAHEDRNPSFRIDDRTWRYHCSCGSGDILDLIIAMGHARNALEAAKWVRHVLGLPPIHARQDKPAERAAREAQAAEARRQAAERSARTAAEDAQHIAAQVAKARAAWARSIPIEGTPAETYLRSHRKIDARIPASLHGLPPRSNSEPGAMIAAFALASEPEPGEIAIALDGLQGVHLTFVANDGSPTRYKGSRKITLGRAHDLPIVLAHPGDGLGLAIAEGIEDALSVHQATGLGAWAAGTAGRLPGLARHVPDYIEAVTVLIDSDPAGQRNGRSLADALHQRGVEVLTRKMGVRADAA